MGIKDMFMVKGGDFMRKILICAFVFLWLFSMSIVGLSGAWAENAEAIKNMIGRMDVGEPVHYENLTIIPLYSARVTDHTPYTTLEQALENNRLKITEIDGGQVPTVKLTNLSDKYIFIMGGEILTGCKQDRIIGRDVLIKPGSKHVVVPVYCVEQGRWTYQSKDFYSKNNLGTPDLRAEAQTGSSAAQGKIWDKISRVSAGLDVQSTTNSYQAIYEDKNVKDRIMTIEQKMGSIPHLFPDTIGVIVGVGGKIISVDIFASPFLFQQLWPKIIKASAMSAVTMEITGNLTQEDAVKFLRKLHNNDYLQRPAIDLGFEYFFADKLLSVNSLIFRNVVIHLAGFPQQEDKAEQRRKNNDQERRIPVIRR
ncbi:MAG: DUF6569 family protein [Candidatus Omnitrophota bacterium]